MPSLQKPDSMRSSLEASLPQMKTALRMTTASAPPARAQEALAPPQPQEAQALVQPQEAQPPPQPQEARAPPQPQGAQAPPQPQEAGDQALVAGQIPKQKHDPPDAWLPLPPEPEPSLPAWPLPLLGPPSPSSRLGCLKTSNNYIH